MKKFVLLLFIAAITLFNTVSFAQDPWDDFTVPYLNFNDEDDGETEGAQLYHALVPDKEAYILPVCEDVSRLIYFDPSEALNVLFLNYTIEHYDGISQKSGAPPIISILFSTQHIETVWAATEDSLAIEAEIYGILFHELTHGYQLEPVGAGEYDGSSEFWAEIEGLADAVRIRAGYHQETSPNSSPSKWLAGYTTTGYFYNWIANNYDCDFLKKLNLSINAIEPWTFEEACMSITGIHADTLWNAYVDNLGIGERPDPEFEADQTLIEVGQSVNFTNLSEDAFCHAWTFEGGSPRRSYEDNPTITYNTPGKYKVTLVSQNTNADGTGIEVKDHYITVVAGLNTPENAYKKTTLAIRPNPFTAQSELKLTLPKPATVQIEIMDLNGRQVAQIYNGELSAGEQTFIWDGRDSSTQQVAAGTYFWKIIEDEKIRTEAIQYHH